MSAMAMLHEENPKAKILKEIGDISAVEIFNNQLLCAVYIRPEKTRGGIMLPGSTRDEDKYQGKIGLIVATGPSAFVDDTGVYFKDTKIKVGDWVIFRPSDGWSLTVNGVLCRMIDDTHIRGRVDTPDRIW